MVWVGAREPAEHYWEQLKDGAHDGPAGAGLTASPAPRTSQNVGRIGTW